MEIWKNITNYEGYYQVSNYGKIKRVSRINKRTKEVIPEKILIPRPNNKGYHRINLSKKGIIEEFLIHRLVAYEFIDNPNSKLEVNHKNGIRGDNRSDNLEWMNKSENNIHSYEVLNRKATWQDKKGKDNYSSKCVHQYDLNMNYIETFPCRREAGEKTGIDRRLISACCLGKQKTAGGYIWKNILINGKAEVQQGEQEEDREPAVSDGTQ